MKVVVSSTGPTLDSAVDPRFGRCEFFVLVDTEDMKAEGIENAARESMGGAGIKAAQQVGALGAEAIITGNIGPNAYDVLKQSKIKIFTGASGTVREAVGMFKKGQLKNPTEATNGPMKGVGGGGGMGGGGMGRGGRGMGGGGGGMGGGGRGRGGGGASL